MRREAYFQRHAARDQYQYFVEAFSQHLSHIDNWLHEKKPAQNWLSVFTLRQREVTPTKMSEYRVQHLAEAEVVRAGPGPRIMFLEYWVITLTAVEDGPCLRNVKANIFTNQTFPKLQAES